MTPKIKKLLIVNYDFPPAGGAGIKRCLKFMKFLPENGWACTVLTVKDGNHHIIDPSLLSEALQNAEVHRAFTFESLFTGASQPNHPMKHGDKNLPSSHAGSGRLRSVYKSVGQFIKVPDSRMLWFPAAARLAKKLVRKTHYDAIFATGPSFTNLVLAAVIKGFSNTPLIVDFRDAWLADPMLLIRPYLRKYHAALEKYVITRADRVISTNPSVTKDFQERYSKLNSLKFLTLYNGYDIDDFSLLKECGPTPTSNFTIVYTGRLYGERTPKHFLEGLKLALDREPAMRKDTKVVFVGSCEEFLDGKYIEDYLREFGIEDVVELTGHISRKASLEYQLNASVLLLIIGIVPREMEHTYGLSGKVFDYMITRRPILTLANGGATRQFIEENQIGDIFFHEDVHGIKNYIIDAYGRFNTTKCETAYCMDGYRQFDFRSITTKLSEQLNILAKNNQ